jgi:L-ascorbate metabolism protein UlaG (beta-lactamase superfamily)
MDEIFRNQSKEEKMKVSRRQFFAGMGGLVVASGLSRLKTIDSAMAGEPKTIGKGKIRIAWLGHGSFLFTSVKGRKILLDPWIRTNPKCPVTYRKIGGFGSVDLILWTHGHVDHFMLPDAKDLVSQYRPKVVAPWELSFFIKSQIPEANCQTFTLANKGATADFDGIKITMTEAFHSAGAQLTGFEGINRFVGEAAGYIIEFENGFKIYHSGDTSLMGDMKYIIGDYYKPDLAILPIGGVFTMGPKEAAFACKLIGPGYVIPEHYGTFPVLVQNADEFIKEVKHYAPKTKTMVIEPGQEIKI